MNNNFSSAKNVHAAVTQGSIDGPIIFNFNKAGLFEGSFFRGKGGVI